jgi:transposase
MGGNGKFYTDEFKKRIVALRNNGKSVSEISTEYTLAKSTINKWVFDYSNTGSFKAKDNRSESENELLKLKKETSRLEMENDILKQAALMMGQR